MTSKSQVADLVERKTCERCQGNGEIVTDWSLYLNPPDGAPDDAGAADCPDCDGQGDVAALTPEPKP